MVDSPEAMGDLSRIFLLSPAACGGRRAQVLMNDRTAFPLADRFHREGASLGEVFSFLSGLYFRGKLAYATAFATPPPGVCGVLVITPNRGLVPAAERIDLERFRFGQHRSFRPALPPPVRKGLRRSQTGSWEQLRCGPARQPGDTKIPGRSVAPIRHKAAVPFRVCRPG